LKSFSFKDILLWSVNFNTIGLMSRDVHRYCQFALGYISSVKKAHIYKKIRNFPNHGYHHLHMILRP
jgi:hypothetical protein